MSAWTIPSYAEWAVPGYAEERLLGHGVSGRVVAAANEATGQRVAIKYFDANLVRDTEFVSEFRSEAERLRSLDAAHMARIFGYVEQPGQGAAIVMELVDGISLREIIARRGPLGAEAALVVLNDSLLALAAAHSRRVPHRDIKPDNVLIDARGWCTLTDFGVAVKADKQMPAAGTPAYMAPELWNGAPHVPAADMYAATAVLCESVTGEPPFSGRLGQLRHQHESAPVELDRFDQPLQGLIARGMAKNPADRPRNARSFANELAALATAAYGPYWEDQGRRELAERAAALLPLAGGGGGSATATRLARRKMLTFVSVAAAALVALVTVAAVALSGKSDNAQLSSTSAPAFAAQVTVRPAVAASKCTTSTTFSYSGTVTAIQPGTLSYRWLYSSGKQGPAQTLTFAAAGHRQVSGGAVKASTSGGGWAEIKMLSPVAETSNKATYKLLCSSTAKAAATATAGTSAHATAPTSSRSPAASSASPGNTTKAPTSTATTASPARTASSPTPPRTTSSPTPPASSPTPPRTTSSPTPAPTTPTPTTSNATGTATATS